MIDPALPGMEEIAERNARVRAERLEAFKQDVIDCCLRVIDLDNRSGITPHSWTLLRLETAIKRLRDNGRS